MKAKPEEIKVICDECGETVSVKVLPYIGTPMREYQDAQIKTESECGGDFHPVTKNGTICPNEIFTVQKVLNSENETVVEMSMYSTLDGHAPPAFGSFIDSEEALSIIDLIESGKKAYSFAEASRVREEFKREIAEQSA